MLAQLLPCKCHTCVSISVSALYSLLTITESAVACGGANPVFLKLRHQRNTIKQWQDIFGVLLTFKVLVFEQTFFVKKGDFNWRSSKKVAFC